MREDKDVLTGLDTYEVFLAKLEKAFQEMGSHRIAVVYTDIKHFKYINDTYGYQHGDQLLRDFSEEITRDNPYMLCAAHVYSDNIIMAGMVGDDYTNEDFRQIILNRNRELEDIFREKYRNESLTFCTGISILSATDRRLDAGMAVSNANLARKMAKGMAEDNCVLFDEKMMEGIRREVEITSSVPEAIKDHEFQVYYQPKIGTKDKKLVGAEALVRWKKPDGHFVYPDDFIPVVEQSGQVVDVDYFVYREVFRFIAEKLKRGQKIVPISLNISRIHLNKMGILGFVQSLFDEYQIPPEMVEFELTESIYIQNPDKAMQLVNGLHAMGTKVSMDDFGSGYSSLNLLSTLPIDVIKLDKVFLKEDELKESDKIIISCVVDMAKKLRITSLCEGVETQAQSGYLSQIGCEIQQGYYFSRPIPQTEFETFMDEYAELETA